MKPTPTPASVDFDDVCPKGTLPRIAGMEVADSSFGLWLAAGGERRQGAPAERAAWTPEQRAQRQQQLSSAWDPLRMATLKR